MKAKEFTKPLEEKEIVEIEIVEKKKKKKNPCYRGYRR